MSDVTLQFRSDSTGDDGYWKVGTFNNSANELYMGNISSAVNNTFILFEGCIIPPGATIVSAYVRMSAAGTISGVPSLLVYANDTATPTVPTNVSEADALSLTSGVAWDDQLYVTPDLKDIIQTIVDKSGWAIGNDIMIVIKDDSSTANHYRYIYSYDKGAASLPVLEVTWTLPDNWLLKNSAVSGDDGYYYYNESLHTDLTYAIVGTGAPGDNMYDCNGFFRMPNVAIDNARLIEHAYIILTCEQTRTASNHLYLKVRLNDADSAVAPTTYTEYSALDLTTAAIDWDDSIVVAERVYHSPDIATVVQEVINRASWVSGNALMVLVEDDDGTLGEIGRVYTYDNGSKYPQLLIEYDPLIPNITDIDPDTGGAGDEVTITGVNFSETTTENTVAFNGTLAVVTSATATSLVVTVPVGASTGTITVTTSEGTATSGETFTISESTTPPNNWTAVNTGYYKIVDGAIAIYKNDTSLPGLKQAITTTVGDMYKVTASGWSWHTAGHARLTLGTTSGGDELGTITFDTTEEVKGIGFVATTTTVYVQIECNSDVDIAYFDYVSAYQISGVLWENDTGGGLGRFSDAPNGMMVYCNGAETCVWGGDGIPCAGFITSTADVTDAPTNPRDFTDVMMNTRDDSENTAVIGGGIDSYTVLMLHGDGADASTTFTDSSATGHTFAAGGDAEIDTAQAKFGTGSILLDGTGDYLTESDHANWNFSTGAFTVDCLVRLNALPSDGTVMTLYGQYVDANNGAYFGLWNDGGTYKLVCYVNNAATTHNLSAIWDGVATNTWYHIAYIRGWGGETTTDAGWQFTVDGTALTMITGGATSDITYPDLAADFEIGRFNGGSYFNGWIDEFRISKGIARWTAAFSRPVAPYATSALYWLVRSPLPLQGVKIYIVRGNADASTLTVKEWNGYSWQSLTVTDGTQNEGETITLYETGEVSWSSTVSTSKIKFIEGMLGYWYLFSIDAGEAEIYYIMLDAPFQGMKDIWDGIDRSIHACFKYTTTYTDYTLPVYEDYYDSSDDTSYADLSSLGAYNAGANCILIGSLEQLVGINIGVAPDATNSTAATTAAIDYWAGTAYAEVSNLVDGTSEGGISLAKSGTLSWTAPDSWNVFKRTVANNSVAMFYYRLRFDDALDATTKIYYVSGIPAPKQIRAYKFPLYSQDRVMLCSNMDGRLNSVLMSSADTAQVFNGEDSYEIYFGTSEELNCGCTVFSQYSSSLYNITMFFKNREIWGLVQIDDKWKRYRISDTIGCPAPLTLQTIVVPPIEGQQSANRCLAIWMAADGVYVSDGRHPINVSHDIRNLWDQNASVHINTSYINSFAGFVDKDKMEYHLLVALTTGTVTAVDAEYALDLRRWQWFEVDRGTGRDLQCGVNVIDSYGNNYTYGFIDAGYCERLEYGTDFDGENIVSTLYTGDFMLPQEDPLVETEIKAIVPVVKAKTTSTASMKIVLHENTTDLLLGDGSFTGAATNWTLASGWAYSANTVVKNAAGTGTLSHDDFIPIIGCMYRVQFTISTWTAGTSLIASLGGANGTTVVTTGTYTQDITATTTDGLAFTPTTDVRCTIDSITVNPVYEADLTKAGYRVTFPTDVINSAPALFHAIELELTDATEAKSFEPLGIGIYYQPVRERDFYST